MILPIYIYIKIKETLLEVWLRSSTLLSDQHGGSQAWL